MLATAGATPELVAAPVPFKGVNFKCQNAEILDDEKITSLLKCHIQEYAEEHWISVIVDTSKLSSQTHNQTENLKKAKTKMEKTMKTYQSDIFFSTAEINCNNEIAAEFA